METSNFPTLSRYLFGGPFFRVMLLLGLIISTFDYSEAMPAGMMDSAYRHYIGDASFFHELASKEAASYGPSAIRNDKDLKEFVLKNPDARLLNLERSTVTDEGLKHVAKLKNLVAINFSKTMKITGPGLEHLAGLKKLKELVLYNIGFSDFSQLSKLKNLERIYAPMIFNARSSLQGMKSLAQLKKLRYLHLSWSSIRAEDFVYFSQMKNLETLNLYACLVTAENVAHLTGLKNLKSLIISSHPAQDPLITQVETDIFITAMKKSSPTIEVRTGY